MTGLFRDFDRFVGRVASVIVLLTHIGWHKIIVSAVEEHNGQFQIGDMPAGIFLNGESCEHSAEKSGYGQDGEGRQVEP